MSSFQVRPTKTPYAHQRNARQQNTSALLFDLWHNAPQSRAALAQRNGLTKATVSAICDELTALNLIRKWDRMVKALGRPESVAAQSPGGAVDGIGANYVAVLLTNLCGDAVWLGPRSSRSLGCPQEKCRGNQKRYPLRAHRAGTRAATCLLGIGVAVPALLTRIGDRSSARPPWGGATHPSSSGRHSSGLPVIVENRRAPVPWQALHGSRALGPSFTSASAPMWAQPGCRRGHRWCTLSQGAWARGRCQDT